MSVRSSSVALGRLSMVAVAVAAVSPVAVLAQTTEAAPERIQVTGSRILREGAIAPSPVTVISGRDLVETGAMNIGEVLKELPSLAATYTLANAGRSIGTAGLSLLDLRGMGASRTLVLVDGRRHVSSSAGSASVDTNSIPTAWLDSVEIITGGASAVYGADAVTGVVNFRLKKDIQGFEMVLSKGFADDNPYENHKALLSFGTDFAGGRGNFAVAAEFSGQDGMNATERSKTRTPYMSVANPLDGDYRDSNGVFIHDGIPDRITVANAGWYDSSTAGNFFLNGDWYIFNQDGSVRLQDLGTTYGNIEHCSNCEFLNLREYQDLQPGFNRQNLNMKANFDLTDSINLFAEGKYVRSKGSSEGQPSFFEYGSAIQIKRDNAFLDESTAALMDANNLQTLRIHRFQKDAGRRFEQNTRTTSRFVVGAQGELSADWGFEAYVTHGETKLEQVNHNNLMRTNFAQSVDAIVDANGNIVCRDVVARANGCVPTSLFGDNAINQGARDWFNTTSYSHSTIRQQVANASVNNSAIFELPAGNVGFSAGVEYRNEESESVPDRFAATGATFLNSLQYMRGEFDVKEAFTEISIPLLADLPLVQDLTFDAAVRYADYSTIGDATSWKTGLDWNINGEFRIRATYSEALRAPNIGELFGPQNQTFFRVTDPCATTERQSQIRVNNCAAIGIAPDLQLNNPAATVEGLSGGNPDLLAEKSNSYTVGFVLQPEAIRGFSLTVDYWSIEIDDAIAAISAQNILNRCVDSASGPNMQFCNLVQRNPETKGLQLITSVVQNVASQTASGVDFEFGYDFDALNGRFNTKLIGTWLESRKTYSFQDFPSEYIENAGVAGDATWQANLSVNYRYDAWTAGVKTRYIDAVSLYTSQSLALNPDPSDIMSYGSYFVTDIRVGYDFASGVKLAVGMDNVFNRNLPGVSTGTTVETGLYNNIGRFYYTSLSYAF
ncbi:TonB-dependent receptor [Alishewanella longhuensis]|uniref:TonB-dependent receptor n=1 Tax=Alishewanella longhuensis TaxID=1091037 RepID=A0ABQ3L2R2_9ALTE|nr:TonB-dependent receptor [Alishewanella longhuensis]GHG61027.1 TonB-dependent receptor [Alishewanella longhuensis]